MAAEDLDHKPHPDPRPEEVERAAGTPAAVTHLAPYAAQTRLRAAIEHLEEASRLLSGRPGPAGMRDRDRRIGELIGEIARDIDRLRAKDPE